MFKFESMLFWLHSWALDMVILAISWQLLLSKALDTPIDLSKNVILGFSVWLTYAGDRWLDSIKIKPRSNRTKRHLPFELYPKAIILIWLSILWADIALAWTTLPREEFIRGTLLLLICIIYTWCTYKKYLPHFKELSISIIFTYGIFLFLLPSKGPLTAFFIYAFLFTFALFFSNAVLISWWEKKTDKLQGQHSLAQVCPKICLRFRSLPLLIIAGTLLLISLKIIPLKLGYSYLISAALLYYLEKQQTIKNPERLHLLADVALMSPLLILFFKLS